MWQEQPTPDTQRNIIVDPLFPTLKVDDFSTQYRIPLELPAVMIDDALIRATYTVIQVISPWSKPWTPILNTFFARAVFCRAKAELLREAPTFMRLKAAENPARFSEETEDLFLTLSNEAIRALLGEKGQATITLI